MPEQLTDDEHEPDEERGPIYAGAARDTWRLCKRRCGAVLKPDGKGGWTSNRPCGEPEPMPPGGMRSWERGAGPGS